MPPATRMWFSLMRIAVVQTGAVVRAAAAAHRVLLERAQAGRRLARVEDARGRALGQLDEAARERGDPAQAADEVERDALAGEDRPRRAFDDGEDGGNVGDRGALLDHAPRR